MSKLKRGDRLDPDDLGSYVNVTAQDAKTYTFIGTDLEQATRFAESIARPGSPVYVCKIVRVVEGRIATTVKESASE